MYNPVTPCLKQFIRTPNWEDCVHLTFNEIRLCGANNAQVARRLRSSLKTWCRRFPRAGTLPARARAAQPARPRSAKTLSLGRRTWRSPGYRTRKGWAGTLNSPSHVAREHPAGSERRCEAQRVLHSQRTPVPTVMHLHKWQQEDRGDIAPRSDQTSAAGSGKVGRVRTQWGARERVRERLPPRGVLFLEPISWRRRLVGKHLGFCCGGIDAGSQDEGHGG